MQILTVDTGNKQLDEAYKRIQVHMVSYDNFESFENYFNTIIKDTDKDTVFKWLLKVLYWEFKYGRESIEKHDFDVLCERVSPEKKAKFESWLQESLKSVGGDAK